MKTAFCLATVNAERESIRGGGSSSLSSSGSVVAPRSSLVHSPGSVLSGSAVGGWQSQASGSVVALASVAPVAPATELQSNLTNAAGLLFRSNLSVLLSTPMRTKRKRN